MVDPSPSHVTIKLSSNWDSSLSTKEDVHLCNVHILVMFPFHMVDPSPFGWGGTTRTLVVHWFLGGKGFRHPTKNECMGWFAQISPSHVTSKLSSNWNSSCHWWHGASTSLFWGALYPGAWGSGKLSDIEPSMNLDWSHPCPRSKIWPPWTLTLKYTVISSADSSRQHVQWQ